MVPRTTWHWQRKLSTRIDKIWKLNPSGKFNVQNSKFKAKMAVHKKFNNGIRNNALGRGLDALISTEEYVLRAAAPSTRYLSIRSRQTRTSHDGSLTKRRCANSPIASVPSALSTYHPATDFGKPIPDYCGRKTMESFTTSWTHGNTCLHPHHQR